MPNRTPRYSIPYPIPADALVDYPALGSDLASTLEALLAKAPAVLWDSVDAGVALPVSAINTPNLPQTYRHLLAVWRARSDVPAVGGQLSLAINGNLGGHYDQLFQFGAAYSSVNGQNRNAARVGTMTGASARGPNFSQGVILIPYYAEASTNYKTILALAGSLSDITAGVGSGQITAAFWGSGVAVQTVRFFSDNGAYNFVGGSRFTVVAI